ncbi:transglutaminase domain-containing protein [Paenibacillus massiliensis]|uniref:transglutaminase domain-containing protein n=1 Tax=Paenibacillus massiliensis TaxID=225917 RepID=UPI000410AF2F|nr:transglutaminase domain-containing protein [Paenibacillus massiliensis]
MEQDWLENLTSWNWNGVTVALIVVVVISLLQGWRRGASRSAGALFNLIVDGVITVAGILGAFGLAAWLSPIVQSWLADYMTVLIERDTSTSSFRDMLEAVLQVVEMFPLLRFALLFLLSYIIVMSLLRGIYALVMGRDKDSTSHTTGASSFLGRLSGAGIGVVIGAARAMMLIAVLFIGVSLYPSSSFSSYVQASPIYSKGAQTVVAPLTGGFIKDKLPVLTQAVTKEFSDILRQKYEIIDRSIPADIEGAAAELVRGASGDEEKARRLYDWVGSRIAYDYDKVEAYEQRGEWREQTPRDTFDTRRGVCIDYARLYAVMARSQGLQVKVVTGLGYNGAGGYGPHAWNEVYIAEQEAWIPLDATWAQSGNWFNPSGFAQTHIPDEYADTAITN